jgi:Alpha-tubulin suppressor and related RCC1 domain-containing proteins
MRRKLGLLLLSILLATAMISNIGEARAASTKPEYKKLEAGKFFTAALTTDGTLSIWGSLEGMNEERYMPVFGKAKEWADVSAGIYFITAIKKDGTMWSWGFNDKGQVGNGTTKNVMKPTQIGTNKKWRIVSSNYAHSIAIAQDGTLWGWGYNPFGEVGSGDLRDKSKPVQIGKDKDWVQVVTGEFFSLGVKKDGSLYAWGDGEGGSFGNGKSKRYQPTPVKVGTSGWKSLSAGSGHVLALKADGTLWAWGYNGYWQLGNGTNKNALKPIRIGKEAGWVAVSASGYDSYALKKDGTLWGWGETFGGTPRQVGLDRDWSKLAKHAAGGQHVILQKQDGSLWGWGNNGSGQITLGVSSDSSFDMRNIPLEVSQTLPAQGIASEIALAEKHQLIKEDDAGFYKSDVTRELAARLYYYLFDALSWDDLEIPKEEMPFDDLYSAIPKIAYKQGLIEPFSKDRFGLYEPLSRQDFLTGLYRTLKLTGVRMDSLPQQWAKTYADSNAVSAKAKEAMQYLDQAGLLKNEGDKLRPAEAVSREEAYVYVWRAYEKYLANTPYSAAAKAFFYDEGYRILAGHGEDTESYFVYDKDVELADWTRFYPRTDGGSYNRDDSLPARITVDYTPGKDERKLDVIAKVIEKEMGIELPSFKQELLTKFAELKIDDLPYAESTGEQYITVDGKELLIILFNESKTKQRILEVDY